MSTEGSRILTEVLALPAPERVFMNLIKAPSREQVGLYFQR